MATSEASVITLIGASGLGCTNNVAFANAVLISSKAVVATESHWRERLLAGVAFSKALSGVRISAQLGINQR